MLNYRTLSLYLSLNYLKYFFFTTFILICFLCLAGVFDTIESYKNYSLNFFSFIQLITLKIPQLINYIAPLITFIATVFFLKNLIKNNELTILLSNGISFLQVLMLPIIISFILGSFFILIVSPFSTYSLHKLEKLENKIKKRKASGLAVLASNILFFEEYEKSNRIIQAQSLDFSTKKFYNVTILILNSENNLVERIETSEIILEDKYFRLINPSIIKKDNQLEQDNNLTEIRLPTNLSINNFIERYLSPQLIYIWNLPKIINNFSKSGFPVNDYKIYYYKQLSKPLYMVTMVLIGSIFISLSNARSNKQSLVVSIALLIGVVTFSLLEIITKILIIGGIYPIWAILLPIFLISMLVNFVILHFH